MYYEFPAGLVAQDWGLRAMTSPKANAPHAPGSPFHSFEVLAPLVELLLGRKAILRGH